ncbi:MAG: hypothetical protein ACR2NU_00255 [Aeoliella sp.]
MLGLATSTQRLVTVLTAASVFAVLIVVTVGCQPERRSNRPATSGRAASSERTSALLQSVANELSNLADRSIVTLNPPVITLDAKKSSDGQDVLAQLMISPDSASRAYNLLEVPKQNSRFREYVRPGYIAKFYGVVSSELNEEFGNPMQALSPNQIQELSKLPAAARDEVLAEMIKEMRIEDDFVSTTAIELTVAQVIDDHTLLIEEVDPRVLAKVVKEEPMRLEILRYDDARFLELRVALTRYANDGFPSLGWEPSPDKLSLERIVERLNRWLRQSSSEVVWRAPALLATLPDEFRDAEQLQLFTSTDALGRNAFSLPTEELRATQAMAYEGRLLQEATWSRDISAWVGSGEVETLPRVEKIFDWTVRNLQLDFNTELQPAHRPWQSLVSGHATAEGRAWVFAQLCRQQNVPVVIVRPALAADTDAADTDAADTDAADTDDADTDAVGVWWCGALVGKKIHLFDPVLGLPLPGPEGSPATLAQLREDPTLLRQFDLPDDPYPAGAESLASLTAQIVAGPFSLTRRAALLEERLTASARLALRVDADVIAASVKENADIAEAQLWEYPYQILLEQLNQRRGRRTRAAIEFEPFVYRPRLWKARMLHFRGRQGMQSDDSRGDIATQIDDHRDAGRLYTHKNVRPRTSDIAQQQSADARRAWTKAKENATYWLGLLCYDRNEPTVAINDWLEPAAMTEMWRQGARFNHARALEQLGKPADAASILNDSQQPRGSRVRAQFIDPSTEATAEVE